MNKTIELKRKDEKVVKARFEFMNLNHINDIMKLQDCIMDALDEKELYAPSEKEDFEEYINGLGKIIGVFEEETNKLIAMGVYGKLGYDESNYGYDIDLNREELINVGQIESTLVEPEYRGNSLQRKICAMLEEVSRKNNDTILCATVSPYNKYSLNSFLDLGYSVRKDKLKYGGLRRYVVAKEL